MSAQQVLPWIVLDYCEGCTSCVASCRRGCLKMFATQDEEVFVPWIEDVERCTGCGLCSEACVLGGISMTAYVGEAAERFRKKLGDGSVRQLSA